MMTWTTTEKNENSYKQMCEAMMLQDGLANQVATIKYIV